MDHIEALQNLENNFEDDELDLEQSQYIPTDLRESIDENEPVAIAKSKLANFKRLFDEYKEYENGQWQLDISQKMDLDKFEITQIELLSFLTKIPDESGEVQLIPYSQYLEIIVDIMMQKSP